MLSVLLLPALFVGTSPELPQTPAIPVYRRPEPPFARTIYVVTGRIDNQGHLLIVMPKPTIEVREERRTIYTKLPDGSFGALEKVDYVPRPALERTEMICVNGSFKIWRDEKPVEGEAAAELLRQPQKVVLVDNGNLDAPDKEEFFPLFRSGVIIVSVTQPGPPCLPGP